MPAGRWVGLFTVLCFSLSLIALLFLMNGVGARMVVASEPDPPPVVHTIPAAVPAGGAPVAPAVVLTKTVGTDPNLCATDQSLDLPAGGGQVFYCYMMRNTGTVSFSRLTLVDDRLGTILNNFPFTLSPGSSAFITQTATITVTTVNSATFTAFNPGPTDVASSSDQATVNVAPALVSVVLTKTVGLDPAICATTAQVQLPLGGGPVTYCYQMTNTGNIDLNRLTLDDNRIGSILASFPFNLTPGASAFITVGAAITRTTDNLATFTAVKEGTSFGAADSDRAQVLVPGQVFLPFIRRGG